MSTSIPKPSKEKEQILYPSFLAGASIGIAAVCNLKGGIYVGALLFAFGLSTIVCSKWKLFTGTVGFVNGFKDLWRCGIIIMLNVVGAIMASLLGYYMGGDVFENADKIVNARLSMIDTPLKLILLSIGCGFIMTVSVQHARKGQWIPLLFGIPTFVVCGFPHCVADIVYYSVSDIRTWDVIWAWLLSVVGNTIGCNIPTLARFGETNDKN